MTTKKFNIAVLISGHGSTLQAIINAIATHELTANISLVLSDQADAYGLKRASQHNIPTQIISKQAYPSKNAYDQALIDALSPLQPDLIVLAGFMRILTPTFVNHYTDKIINIHPSLLPKYRGLHTHERVLESGDEEHGTSIHIVNEGLDSGPIIAQARCGVLLDDTPDLLKARVQSIEQLAYPQVIQWFASKRLLVKNHQLTFDGVPLLQPIDLDEVQMSGTSSQ